MKFATEDTFKFAKIEVDRTYHKFNGFQLTKSARLVEAMELTSLFDYFLITSAGDEAVIEAVMVKPSGEFFAIKSTFGHQEGHQTAAGSLHHAAGSQFSETLATVQEQFLTEMNRPMAA